jgi:cystathionine beta-lyase
VSNPLGQLTLDDLRRRTSVKWRLYPDDVLPLFVAEMDTPAAPAVAAALHAAVDRGDTGYAVAEQYVAALAGFAKARWDWAFPEDHAVLVPDVMLGIVEVLKLLTSAGDAVVVNSPVYMPFYGFIGHLGRRVVEAPLDEDFRIDLSVLENAFAAARTGRATAAFLLCSPHNPTGTVHTADELREVVRLAEEYGVRVVVDEIHAPLVYAEQEYTPYLTVPGSERGIVLHSASKAWNLAGLKAAAAVAGVGAVGDLRRMPEEASHGASHLGVIAHEAAYRDGAAWLDDLLAGLDGNRHLLAELLDDRLKEVRYQPPASTYLAWLDCRALGLGDDPAAAFLATGRVALNSGPAFGTGGAGFARLNLATNTDILREAVDRMAAAVAEAPTIP